MRHTQIELRSAALIHNFRVAQQLNNNQSVLAVVKANAYGHGAEFVIRTLQDIENPPVGYAVINADEALLIREAGLQVPLLLLQGLMPDDDVAAAIQMGLDLTIHSAAQLQQLMDAQVDLSGTELWLKADTGMGRLGFQKDNCDAAYRQLKQLKPKTLGLLSHFACADTSEHLLNQLQTQRFTQLAETLQPDMLSLANSAALMSQIALGDMTARPGIMLYGGAVLAGGTGVEQGLQPVMKFTAPLVSIKQHQAGDNIGYGGVYQCPNDMFVGTVAAGYGDGYPRHLHTQTNVAIQGVQCPVIGRISMDSLAVDLTPLENNDIDYMLYDEVELWGDVISADEVAIAANTIAYELFCGINTRVHRNIA